MTDEDPLSPANRQRYIDELALRSEGGPTFAELIEQAELDAAGAEEDFDDAMAAYRNVVADRTHTRGGIPRTPNADGVAEIEEAAEEVNQAEENLTLARSRLSHLLGEQDAAWAEVLNRPGSRMVIE